eukprot:12030159-Alexandrium_andersonii.AAC.1
MAFLESSQAMAAIANLSSDTMPRSSIVFPSMRRHVWLWRSTTPTSQRAPSGTKRVSMPSSD